MFKRFKNISEIDDIEKKEQYVEFVKLNEIIENEQVSRAELEESYTNVLLGINVDTKNTTDLYSEVQFLLDNIKVSVTSILGFYDYKFTSHYSECVEFIKSIPFDVPDEIKTHLIKFLSNETNVMDIELYTGFGDSEYNYYFLFKDEMTTEEIHLELNKWVTKAQQIYIECLANPTREFVIGLY